MKHLGKVTSFWISTLKNHSLQSGYYNLETFFFLFFHKSTKFKNIIFCDNFIDKSLVLILKYAVCEFYGCAIILKEMRLF